jgi:hypothetical protein
MTMIECAPGRARSPLRAFIRAYRRWRDARTVESLPHELRKDIGWRALD